MEGKIKRKRASSEAALKPSAPQSSNGPKPPVSISLDLDNQWSYMKTHGDLGWRQLPSYLDIAVPSVLDILEHMDLKITFFIVGQDAALDKNRDALGLITKKGHEVGNHSFHHEPWLHLYPKDQLKREILEAEEHIDRVTGQRPVGFRGPGFAWSPTLFEVLAASGYIYDASILPTYLGPLARMYFFWKSNLTKEEKARRGKLFGNFEQGLTPVKPYCWLLVSGERMLEIPITTMPFIKTPFHLSYLLYLSRFSSFLMSLYLRTALTLCRITQTAPSFLLHPLDLLSDREVPELAFFPGMDLGKHRKIELFEKVLNELRRHFAPVTMTAYAQSVLRQGQITVKSPYGREKGKKDHGEMEDVEAATNGP